MNYIKLPSGLKGFSNTKTDIVKTLSGRDSFLLHGNLKQEKSDCLCPLCSSKMHIHNTFEANLNHLCFGSTLSSLRFNKLRYFCPSCKHTQMQKVPFQALGHRMTQALWQYTRDLLASGHTNKEVGSITGLGKNTVKNIDMQRLKDKYTIDGNKLIQPEKQAKYLGIDEFKLHNGNKYAVVIIDMETGHILWIAHGKKKATVFAFIEHVGLDWMDGVEAIACDMNSDFEEAFETMCPHIQVVYDYFHIVKYFHEKVVNEVRKDEQARLLAEGDFKAAESLKRSKYVLNSSYETLQRKDEEANGGKLHSKGSLLFNKEPVTMKPGYVVRYEKIIDLNKLFFSLDLIKEKLAEAYRATDEVEMAKMIEELMDICKMTKNEHFRKFYRLLDNHFEGIIAHATYRISAGKIEGINNRIKTIRRQGYGYPDDDYFFLKVFDSSRQTYVRNPGSNKIPQNL